MDAMNLQEHIVLRRAKSPNVGVVSFSKVIIEKRTAIGQVEVVVLRPKCWECRSS